MKLEQREDEKLFRLTFFLLLLLLNKIQFQSSLNSTSPISSPFFHSNTKKTKNNKDNHYHRQQVSTSFTSHYQIDSIINSFSL